MRKRITAIFAVGTLALLTACSSSVNKSAAYEPTPMPMSVSNSKESGRTDLFAYGEDSSAKAVNDMASSTGTSAPSGDSGGQVYEDADQKVIKTANLSLRTENFGGFQSDLTSLVTGAGGYFEALNVDVYDTVRDLRRGSITIRVPQEQYLHVVSGVEGLAKVMSKNEIAQNVTAQYYDIESRMKTKQVEEERLLELIAKAEKIDDLIQLEQRLSYVRTDIEVYKSKLKNIDGLASYSTINIDVTEVKPEELTPVSDDLGTRIKNSFTASVNAVVRFFEALVIFLAAAVVPLCILAVPVIAAVVIWKYQVRKKNKNNERDDKNES